MNELKVKIDVDENGRGVLTSTHFDVIRNKFSWKNGDINFLPKWQRKNAPKRLFAINHDGTFDIGILDKIFNFCKQIDPNLPSKNFKVTSKAKFYYEPKYSLPEKYKIYQFENFLYTDIQENALKRIFTRGRGIVNIGTGGGKGLIMAGVCKTILEYDPSKTVAILVPNHLVEKTYEEFIDDYGFAESELSYWGSKTEENFNTPIIIFGPSLANSRKEKFYKHIATRNTLLIDECHIIKKGSKITELVDKVKTNNIVGFTGTIPKSDKDYWSVMGKIGKVIYEISSKKLKELEIKSESKVNAICFDGCEMDTSKTYVDEDGNTKTYTHQEMFVNEMDYLLKSKERNDFIFKWVIKVCKGNTLIPIDRDYHEEILRNTFKDCGRPVYIINGNTPKDERQTIYKKMSNETQAILIVKTSIMREGISIKNLSYMVGYFSQKAYIRIIQLMGRIERKGGLDVPIFFDFYDTTKYSSKHFETRKNIYKEVGIPISTKNVKLKY